MLHSHTEFCDGRATMAEMAEAALRAGLRRYGFSPHSPLCIPSPCNMKREDVEPYLREARRLKELYAGRIELLAGMEIDYLSADWGPHIDYFQELPLDYRIGSVHFVPTQRGNFVDCDGRAERFLGYLHDEFSDDLEYVCRKYFEQVEEMLERGGLDILGHLDKIAANAYAADPHIEDESWWGEAVGRIIHSATEKGLTIEINTKAWEEKGRFFPAERWWDILRREGSRVAFHSDAHYPERILAGMEEGRRRF